MSGRVLKLHLDSAAPVTAGLPLLEIGDTAAMEAVIDVLSGEVRQVQPGAVVQLSTGSGAAPLPGTVARVEPVAFTKVSALGIEEQRCERGGGAGGGACGRRAPGRRLPSGRAHHRVVAGRRLLLPSAALVRDGALWRVFVVEAARRAPARCRSTTATRTGLVKDGVKAGETGAALPGQHDHGRSASEHALTTAPCGILPRSGAATVA